MPQKKSTSTTSTSATDEVAGGGNLGRANYRAEQARDAVIVFAFGVHPTPGYIDFFEQSPIDIFPPEFIFRSIPPGWIVPQVLTPFAIWVMFGATEPVKRVRVHDADGAHEVPVEQMPKTVAATQATWVTGNVVRGGGVGGRMSTLGIGEEERPPEWMLGDLRMAGAGIFGRATTMATGEEGGGPTTMATGEEEITAPTTMATGEEGGGPTTMATGEEETRMGATFGGPPITTLAVAEEAVATTLALGEEGTTTLRATPTTLAVGEETATTDAIGEEGPTTLALGEENPTTDAVGEEGPTTLALGEETTAVMRTSPFGTF